MPAFFTTFAIALAAGAGTVTAQTSIYSCTTTITSDFKCCPPVAGYTATSYTDCSGCALATAEGAQCKMMCAVPPATSSDLTTTVTSCAPSATPTFETYAKREDKTCTTTAATKIIPACGDCGGAGIETVQTTGVDCGGCALATTTVREGGVGICVCPTETTVTTCLVSPTSV